MLWYRQCCLRPSSVGMLGRLLLLSLLSTCHFLGLWASRERERLQSPPPYHRLHRQQQSGRWELTTGTQDGFKPWPACFCSTTGPICVDSVFTRVRSSSELKVIAMRAAFGRRFNAKQFCGAKSTQKHYLMEAVCHARSKQGMSGGNGAGGSA